MVEKKFSDKSLGDYSPNTADRLMVIAPMVMYETARPAAPDGSGGGPLMRYADEIVKSWIAIGNTWADLRLSWAGDSADKAKELQDRIQKVQRDLFGTSANGVDTPGVLPVLCSNAARAASQFSDAENTVTKMFDEFNNGMRNPDPKQSPVPKSDDREPVTITYDNRGGVRYDDRKPIGHWIDGSGVRHNLLKGDTMPTPSLHTFEVQRLDGSWEKISRYGIEHAWIDDKGKRHTEWLQVDHAEWTDDRGRKQVLDIPAPPSQPNQPNQNQRLLDDHRQHNTGPGPKI